MKYKVTMYAKPGWPQYSGTVEVFAQTPAEAETRAKDEAYRKANHSRGKWVVEKVEPCLS